MRSGKGQIGACAALALALGLAGCVSFPQNAQEFREQIPGAAFGQKKSFEANRPFAEVASTFQAKAPECLSVSVRTVSQTSTSYQNILTTYRPTVRVVADKAEVHVQRRYESGVIVLGQEPEGGMYYLVADAVPIDRNRTRVDIYAPSIGADTLIRAVTGWATGENVGCPDMTRP